MIAHGWFGDPVKRASRTWCEGPRPQADERSNRSADNSPSGAPCEYRASGIDEVGILRVSRHCSGEPRKEHDQDSHNRAAREPNHGKAQHPASEGEDLTDRRSHELKIRLVIAAWERQPTHDGDVVEFRHSHASQPLSSFAQVISLKA